MNARGLLFILWGWAGIAAGHPFAISLAEMEFNHETHVIEVALRVYPEQLERALTLEAGKKISLERTGDVDSLISRYISTRLAISNSLTDKVNSVPRTIRWVGKEASAKEVWIYFEIPLEDSLTGGKIINTLLFDANKEQVNIVNIKDGERVATSVTTRNRPEVPIRWRKRGVSSPKSGDGLEF